MNIIEYAINRSFVVAKQRSTSVERRDSFFIVHTFSDIPSRFQKKQPRGLTKPEMHFPL